MQQAQAWTKRLLSTGSKLASNVITLYLHEEGPPGDEQQDEGQHKGQQVGRDVEEVAAFRPVSKIIDGAMHADLYVLKKLMLKRSLILYTVHCTVPYQCVLWPPCPEVVPVDVVLLLPHARIPDGWRGEDEGEEPDERDEDGVRPGPGNEPVLPGKVPLAVLDEEMERQE